MRHSYFLTAATAALVPGLLAAQARPADAPTPAAPPPDEIVVTARRLDAARDAILPSLGASRYNFDRATITTQPQGEDRSLTNLLLQAPGVAQDSYGQIHVRNEHGNLQYRINGVIVPESITGFGQTIDTRLADSISLLTGTLPAQYGYRTSGVVNITTQTGSFANGGEVALYGGERGTLEPSAQIKGSSGGFNYYASGSYLRNDLGIENPTPARDAIHDRTDQFKGFVYASQILSDTSRVSAFGGASTGRFQIPNNPGQLPGFTVNGVSTFDSARLDQNQHEYTYYGVATYQYSADDLSFQVAPFVRYSRTTFTPDPTNGDIIFNGFSDRSRLSSLAAGVQADASYKLSDRHTVRGGVFFQNERTRSTDTSLTLATDAGGAPVTDVPASTTVVANKSGQEYGVYLQDEWTLTPELTINFGARFDAVHAYTVEKQLSPRINLVYTPSKSTSFHAGYARDFTPPPQELVATTTVAQFVGTTKASTVLTADPVKAEREHYFDAGVLQTVLPGLSLGVDGYYKIKRNLIDEGQFGEAVVLSPFNYADGYAWGIEVSANYKSGPLSLYGNATRGQEKGRNIVSSQFFFQPDELAYIGSHYIFTDHSQNWTASAGASYVIRDGLGKLIPTVDFIYGDGLRAADVVDNIPNGAKLPSYAVFNFGVSQSLDTVVKGLTVRLDVLNIGDHVYEIRDGTGVGVGAPQFGQRRAIYGGARLAF